MDSSSHFSFGSSGPIVDFCREFSEKTMEDPKKPNLNDPSLIRSTAGALTRNWGVEPVQEESDVKIILEMLSRRLAQMLESDFEGLVNAMYRLDVAENDFRAAMGLGSTDKIAPALAQLIWERELKRAWWRKKYS